MWLDQVMAAQEYKKDLPDIIVYISLQRVTSTWNGCVVGSPDVQFVKML